MERAHMRLRKASKAAPRDVVPEHHEISCYVTMNAEKRKYHVVNIENLIEYCNIYPERFSDLYEIDAFQLRWRGR